MLSDECRNWLVQDSSRSVLYGDVDECRGFSSDYMLREKCGDEWSGGGIYGTSRTLR